LVRLRDRGGIVNVRWRTITLCVALGVLAVGPAPSAFADAAAPTTASIAAAAANDRVVGAVYFALFGILVVCAVFFSYRGLKVLERRSRQVVARADESVAAQKRPES
jgi:di/tricarboxylate transporter